MSSKSTILSPGITVRVIRSHHNMNDHCVGKLGTIDRIVMKGIYRIKMNDGFWLFGSRDLTAVTVFEMLGWDISSQDVRSSL